MAIVMRTWTRNPNIEEIANEFDCYPFEVIRLKESVERLLAAMGDLLRKDKKEDFLPPDAQEGPSNSQKVHALHKMIAQGLNEENVTLTFIPGIGTKTANKLRENNIADIEDLAISDLDDLISLGGISNERAQKWIAYANENDGTTIGLSGYSGGKLSKMVDIPLVAKVDDMQKVEDIHMIVVHMIMQAVYKVLNT